jgi:tetratricopeptide (TPR) repeat protein
VLKALGLCFIVLIGCVGCNSQDPDAARAQSAREALARGDLAEAQRFAAEIAPHSPNWAEGQLLLGAAAQRLGNPKKALEYYRVIPHDDSLYPAALIETAAIEHAHGNIHAAIRDFEALLQRRPDDDAARRTLANLLASTGQRRRADAHFWILVTANAFEFKQLVMFTDFDRRDPNESEFLKWNEQRSPRDPAVQTGLAVEDITKGDLTSARRRLELAISIDPLLSAAQGLLGELLVDEGDAELVRWYGQLPPAIGGDPEISYVLGLWAQRRDRPELGAQSFSTAAKAMPASYRIAYKFGRAELQANPTGGGAILAHAQSLFDLRQNLSQFLNTPGGDREALKRVVDLLIDTGREWEARCWALHAQEKLKPVAWAQPILKRLPKNPPSSGLRFADGRNPLDRYHPPGSLQVDAFIESSGAATGNSTELLRKSQVRFRDESADLGIEFAYHHGHVPGTVGVRMQESTGGGVAVIDYDGDDLPDLFFTQGHDWPHDSDVPAPTEKYQDRLFRNLGDGFQDVSRHAGIVFEEGFGQGCTAGDFDNDGFPDLYIANIGKNQLLMNQGDGTFVDATSALQTTNSAWTSSCLIADLNNDGNPDFFDVNYLEGTSLFRRICNETECTPEAYKPARDRLYLSQGDGSFKLFDFETDDRWGSGLGIVAFHIDSPISKIVGDLGHGSARHDEARSSPIRLSLFIANDHEPNFFLINAPAETPDRLALADEAFLRGVAVNQDGRPTASMGIACGDANGDGLLDLFVTNYKNEPSNLYLQTGDGLFEDAIAGSGLLIPGLPYVKWGAQFLDAENDGDLDLVIANGHVGDFHIPGIECSMPTQFFANDGGGRFTELKAHDVGEYFDRRLLGRTLALLDWNRDGLIDVVASPIASPVAILTNRTVGAGNSLSVRLHAVTTARDAIGATVTITTASGKCRQQLTAGDGYQASNERILRFGLGDQTEVERLVIDWPGGTTQVLERVPANSLWDVVEGERAVQVRHWPSHR